MYLMWIRTQLTDNQIYACWRYMLSFFFTIRDTQLKDILSFWSRVYITSSFTLVEFSK